MLKTAALVLTMVGALNTTPAQLEQMPDTAVQSIQSVQQEIVDVVTTIPEPEPEPVPTEPAPSEDTSKEAATKPAGPDFKQILGTCTTSYTPGASNRNTNIRLAATAINGKVLQPGETFSFNTVVGPRTAARGYKMAIVYSAGEAVQGIGGGICQVSSTLFNAALLSDMKITSRTSHGLPVHYLPAGRDATVSWGGPEFKFRNNKDYPVKVTAGYDTANGKLTVSIHGPSTVTAPKVKITVTNKNGTYTTKRTVNGKVNYTTTSRYK